MHSKRARLDRFMSVHLGINRRDVKLLLAQGRVEVDGSPAVDVRQFIDEFTQVSLDGRSLQAKKPAYIMMHKPAGVVSATRDEKHITLVDLLDESAPADLHNVGRLDFNSTGLVLLTNDGRWSRALMTPDTKVPKVYRVRLENPINDDYVKAFSEGIYFSFENITTRPAQLNIIDDYTADVTLVEGRYHQIKRMFGRFQNPVIELHRYAIGSIELDSDLEAGQSRALTEQEVKNI